MAERGRQASAECSRSGGSEDLKLGDLALSSDSAPYKACGLGKENARSPLSHC